MMFLRCGTVALCIAACDGGKAPPGPFDGVRALEYVREHLAFGARVPGTDAHRKAGDWIVAGMRSRADTVIEQRWTHITASGDSLALRNILARYRPELTERILYVTHWDSRPRADMSSDSAQRLLPVPGANDGASGVGLFFALADLLKATPPGVGVDLLFVDGEDYGEFGPPEVDVLLGSKYFARNLPTPTYRPLFGVVWDMIGDKDLVINKEQFSLAGAPDVVERVWSTAAQLGYSKYFDSGEVAGITDDHVPLLQAGLPVIDVIDLQFPWHHTTEDTIDKITSVSLKIVGDVAYALIPK